MDATSDTPPPNYRWNFVAFVVDYVFFSVALSFANPSSVLPAFVGEFTRSAPIIGLVSTVWNGCWLIPQVVAARVINDKPRKKPYLMIGISGRVAFWIVALALWLGMGQYPAAMLLLFFVCLGLFTIPDGLASVAWFDMLARAIPVKRRGRLMGISQVLSGLAGLGVGALIGLILDSPKIPFPADYAWIFTLAGVAFIPSAVALALLRETKVARPDTDTEEHVRDGWLTPLREDPTFRRLMTCRILVGMVSLATPFYVIHATDVLSLPVSVVGGFVAAQQVASVAFGALLGLASDRWGPASTIRIGSALSVVGPLFALLAHVADGGLLIRAYPLVYVAYAAYQSSAMLGFYNYLLEIAPDSARPSYVGLGNTIMGALTLAPILGGWLLETTSYTALFGITTGLAFLGALTTLGLRPATETAPWKGHR
ncbi:MAG: MFS transporter [Chloroflexota bacterium]|nr:MFS transporter [Chloroflexota bacterium]